MEAQLQNRDSFPTSCVCKCFIILEMMMKDLLILIYVVLFSLMLFMFLTSGCSDQRVRLLGPKQPFVIEEIPSKQWSYLKEYISKFEPQQVIVIIPGLEAEKKRLFNERKADE